MNRFLLIIYVFSIAILTPAISLASSFNIDLGPQPITKTIDSSFETPSGQFGEWNQVLLGTQSLVDLDGQITSAMINTIAYGEGNILTGGKIIPLTGDFIFTNAGFFPKWEVNIEGLDIGFYDIYIYGPSHPTIVTGQMEINGQTVDSITGGYPIDWLEGVNYTVIDLFISDGTLSLKSIEDIAAGLSGLQVVPSTTPVPEPTTMLLLGTGLVGLAGIGRKKFFKK